MDYKYEFQYKAPDRQRPYDEIIHEEEFSSSSGEFIPLPNVGDSVYFDSDQEHKAYKVLTRHFSYVGTWCCVNIVVTDISSDEMAARLKE